MFPDLQKTSSPGTTLGNYIKALLPADRGGNDRYQDDYLLPATGIASALEALKGKVIFEPSSFREWRLAWEKELEGRRESGLAPPKKKVKK